jgi:CBS domain-containing protein
MIGLKSKVAPGKGAMCHTDLAAEVPVREATAMKISQLLRNKTGDIASVSPETPIPAVAAMLKGRGIGAVVVQDREGGLAGILSERDIVYALSDRATGLADVTAADLMTAQVQTCSPAQDINDVMRAMTEKRFRHMPVMDQGQLVGIVSIGDAVKSRIEELENERRALETFITG